MYKRKRNAIVGKNIHNVKTTAMAVFKLGGSLKFGVTPAGGEAAGPFRTVWSLALSCSAVGVVVGVAMIIDSHRTMENKEERRNFHE